MAFLRHNRDRSNNPSRTSDRLLLYTILELFLDFWKVISLRFQSSQDRGLKEMYCYHISIHNPYCTKKEMTNVYEFHLGLLRRRPVFHVKVISNGEMKGIFDFLSWSYLNTKSKQERILWQNKILWWSIFCIKNICSKCKLVWIFSSGTNKNTATLFGNNFWHWSQETTFDLQIAKSTWKDRKNIKLYL